MRNKYRFSAYGIRKADSVYILGKWTDKLKTPESTLAELNAINEPKSTFDSAITAVENCYNAATRENTKGRVFFSFLAKCDANP